MRTIFLRIDAYCRMLVVWMALGVPTGLTQAASFQGLGFLPGAHVSSGMGISADGKVVVGLVYRPDSHEAFKWTAEAGMVGLGSLAGQNSSAAYGVAADGSTIAGTSWQLPAVAGTGAFTTKWDENGEVESIATHNGLSGIGISADGAVIVGGNREGNGQAFRWSAVSGVQELGTLPFGVSSWANGVSADGLVVVGESRLPSVTGQPKSAEAFRWTEAEGMVGLGLLAETHYSSALAASADGTTIVGYATDHFMGTAFHWTEANGMIGLGTLPGDSFSVAHAVSYDGSMVGGSSFHAAAPAQAFIWSPATGMLSVQALLEGRGVQEVAGWNLLDVQAMSADGRTVVGRGYDPNGQSQAFVATIDLPPPGDANLDGVVDGADYVTWANHFGAKNATWLQGDFNGDGVVDGADYVLWATNFQAAGSAALSTSIVPEPSSIWSALMGFGVVAAIMAIKRNRAPLTG